MTTPDLIPGTNIPRLKTLKPRAKMNLVQVANWIAWNEAVGDDDSLEEVTHRFTVALAADMFRVSSEQVGYLVWKIRQASRTPETKEAP